MSGLEVLGIAASIVQVADLGARVALKLCTFYHKAKQAEANIQTLSRDVSLTCTVLRQLGDNLKQDEQAKLYSPDAFRTAQEILGECEKVFREIESAIDKDSTVFSATTSTEIRNPFLKLTRRVNSVFKEPGLGLLQTNLDRLKNTMLLMLNVIIYAGQLRKREEGNSIRDQQELVRLLEEQRIDSNQKFERLTKALEGVEVVGGSTITAAQVSTTSTTTAMTAMRETATSVPPMNSSPNPLFPLLSTNLMQPPPQYVAISEDELDRAEITNYFQLINTILSNIGEAKAALTKDRHTRIRNGVLAVHRREYQLVFEGHDRGARMIFRSLCTGPLIVSSRSRKGISLDAIVQNENEEDDQQLYTQPPPLGVVEAGSKGQSRGYLPNISQPEATLLSDDKTRSTTNELEKSTQPQSAQLQWASSHDETLLERSFHRAVTGKMSVTPDMSEAMKQSALDDVIDLLLIWTTLTDDELP